MNVDRSGLDKSGVILADKIKDQPKLYVVCSDSLLTF